MRAQSFRFRPFLVPIFVGLLAAVLHAADPATQPSAPQTEMLRRIRQAVDQLDISKELKAKLNDRLAEAQNKIEAAAPGEAGRREIQQTMQETRQMLQRELTPEQMGRVQQALGGGGRGDRGPATRADTTALKPLTELGEEKYKDFAGGLYPEGKNVRPGDHEKAGLALAKQIVPLGADGKPAEDGKIVLLSIGMSNTTQEFQAFRRIADADAQKNPKLVLVDGAQGGQTAARIRRGDEPFWAEVENRLKKSGVTANQVQVAWIKEADAGPTEGWPKYAQTLSSELEQVVQVLKAKYPNLKLAYLSSRTYAGWAKSALNPEPYAYESGFSVKWLIEKQIKGEASLNCDPAKSEVKSPWLSWGPYLWANGTAKRAADGFSYEEADFGPDGTHPSESGRQKVAKLLLDFFKSDSTTKGWFVR